MWVQSPIIFVLIIIIIILFIFSLHKFDTQSFKLHGFNFVWQDDSTLF